jgi:hypothetical protein
MSALSERLRVSRADEVVARCPVDEWDFAPRYTDGVCPICGWRPEGPRIAPPLAARIDWFWPSVGFLALVSLAMAAAVIVAYVRA